ncbi:phage tail tape measure protein [Clostridium septicum]|uniref:Phage tail tape measure protein n=1 Tax=Clostridium septicum TaxID=1504 RepID=A0A9N7JPB5_CLOSE|nr:phage tail tape measure protein [Clostridium septicum]AYE35317.1 phage tail tape measure protein [Clostridium septicum]UEC20027.1 phage tail tape measure protein [Clostridium septicum]
MADGRIVIDTDLDSKGIENGLSKMSSIAKTGSKSIIASIGGAASVIAGIGIVATKVGMDFEAGMSKVQAISGATAEDMVLLGNKAKEMGSKTKFSATESSEALSYMAMA